MEKINLRVLYEDNHLIAVFKPAGVLVQGANGESSIMEEIKSYLKIKYKKQGNVFLGLIHRLDRNVSGIVLFAKTSKGASRISEQFRERTVDKIYYAWVSPAPRVGTTSLIHYISKDESTNTSTIHNTPASGRSRVELSYRVVDENDGLALIRIELGTGRSHQIRAQLSHIGSPIVGDVKYGSKWRLHNNEILLRATKLSFKKATSDEQVDLEVEFPEKPVIEVLSGV